MNITITTVIYNGYGKFLNQWFNTLSKLDPKPTEIIVVLGKDHQIESSTAWPVNIKVVNHDSDNLGELKNVAVSHATTEWILGLSVDDEILPWAMREFKKHTHADIIVSKYLFISPKGSKCVHPQISKEVLLSKDYYINGKNYMHGSTPFKRSLWLKYHYYENDCFNTLFWIDCAAGGATFSHTQIPCLVYNKYDNSHSDIGIEERRKRFKIINDYRLKIISSKNI